MQLFLQNTTEIAKTVKLIQKTFCRYNYERNTKSTYYQYASSFTVTVKKMKQEEMEKVCQLNELVRERLRVESVLQRWEETVRDCWQSKVENRGGRQLKTGEVTEKILKW